MRGSRASLAPKPSVTISSPGPFGGKGVEMRLVVILTLCLLLAACQTSGGSTQYDYSNLTINHNRGEAGGFR